VRKANYYRSILRSGIAFLTKVQSAKLTQQAAKVRL